jgi:hypothetical protein
MKWDIKNIFVDIIRGQFRDLEAELNREAADVIVGDNAAIVCQGIHERFGIPWAVYGISALTLSSRDTAPFGLAMMPSSSILGRIRNKALHWFNDTVIFGGAKKHNNVVRRELGLKPYDGEVFDFPTQADVYLQGTVPSFEYKRSDMPKHIKWIGASVPQPPVNWTPPAWWGDLETDRPVVLVTQGTINNDYDQLIRPAIRRQIDRDLVCHSAFRSLPSEKRKRSLRSRTAWSTPASAWESRRSFRMRRASATRGADLIEELASKPAVAFAAAS